MTTTTLTIKDGLGANRLIKAIDVAGDGSGPFLPVHGLANSAGTPVDPATSAKQDSLLAIFPTSIGQKASAASLSVTLSSDHGVVPVSVTALPLPTGAATAAAQAATTTALGSPFQAGGSIGNTGFAVTGIADGVDAATGAKADSAYAGSGTASVIALLKGLYAQYIAATPAGELHIGEVGGNTAVVGGSFSRPANTTAYALGQLVANSTTAGSVTPITCAVARKNDGTGVLTGLRLHKSGASITNASFRVHLFRSSPTTTVGDAGTFSGAINGNTSVGIGYFDVTMDQVYSDGAKGYLSFSAKAFTCSTGTPNIFALIEARGAYTPVSGETFTLALEALRD